jgi:tetratricopeptide (TPR) repeat protein
MSSLKSGSRTIRTLFTASILALLFVSTGLVAGPSHAQEDDAQTELRKGVELLRRHRYEDALKSFKHANDLLNHNCAECYFDMAQAYQGLLAYKSVVDSCDKAIELAPADKVLTASIYNLKGMTLVDSAERKDQKKLQEAESALRKGIAIDSGVAILHYNLGIALMQMSRDSDGIAELKKYVELNPNSENADEARKMIENPRRSREAYAPEFAFTSAEGEYISMDDLRGKVVLLDFWGTWCPPCRVPLPSLRDLNKRYAKEKAFVMISVSVHDDEDKWRDFTAKNQMVWPQAFDRQDKIQHAFQVNKFPTYILIDHEGIIRLRVSGYSFEREAALNDAIHKAIKVVAKSGPAE